MRLEGRWVGVCHLLDPVLQVVDVVLHLKVAGESVPESDHRTELKHSIEFVFKTISSTEIKGLQASALEISLCTRN